MLLIFLFVERIDDTSGDMSKTDSAELVKIRSQLLQTVAFLVAGRLFAASSEFSGLLYCANGAYRMFHEYGV